jgi:rRNA maturation endonuclease Nob1
MTRPPNAGCSMAACPQCGHETQTHARYCEQCGAVLAERCAACAIPLPPSSRFCPSCGHPWARAPARQRADAYAGVPESASSPAGRARG